MSDRSRVMTLVTAGCSLAKRATAIDGVVCSTADPFWPRYHAFIPVEITDPEDLLKVLSTAAEERIAPCVVRAEPKAETGRRAIYDDPVTGPAGMFAVPRAWVGIDIEKVPNKAGLDPLRDGAAIAAYVQRCLPQPFRRSTVVWQITASAGKRLDELRCRLWYLLEKPLDGKQLEEWCKPGIKLGWIDPCTLTNVVLPHFLAVQIEGDQADPCLQRWGIVHGEYDSRSGPRSHRERWPAIFSASKELRQHQGRQPGRSASSLRAALKVSPPGSRRPNSRSHRDGSCGGQGRTASDLSARCRGHRRALSLLVHPDRWAARGADRRLSVDPDA